MVVGASMSGSTRPLIVAIVGVLAATAPVPSAAMSDADRQLIELKNLDLVPRGSRLPEERGTRFYGRLDVGLLRRRPPDAERDVCRGDPVPGRGWTAGELSGNLLGIEGAQWLDRGYAVYARIEHSVRTSRGRPDSDCEDPSSVQPFWDRASYVGWGHRDWGWLELGRRVQPAFGVALLADPWAGLSRVASAERWLYRRPALPRDLASDRTNRSITLRTPDTWHWRVELQSAIDPDATDPAGAAIAWQGSGFDVAAGWNRWSGHDWVLPVSGRYVFGEWAGVLGASTGRAGGLRHEAATLGAEHRRVTGAHPLTLRLAATAARADGLAAERLLSLGLEQRRSRWTAWHAEASTQSGPGRRSVSFGAGMRHSFSM